MLKTKFIKIQSAVVSSLIAITALAAPLSSTYTPTLSVSAASTEDYAKLLQYSLYFYDANMCGDQVSSKTGLSWRSNCHTSDEVKGGFHDAGDHAMFGLPQGYSASTLGWGYYEFKDAYTSTGQADHLKLITDYFCDFFKNSTKLDSSGNVTNFLYQKEDGDKDHSYWGAPENQTGSRQMYWTSNGASDIAAEYAASLALNYINFGNAEDLKYAEALYKFSTQYNQVATYGPTGFYGSSSCQDDQAWAAGWLYLATNKETYKNDCASKQIQYLGWVHGWNNAELGAACVYSHITGNWSKVNNYIGSQASGSGYLFMDKWGSARLNTSMQMCALVASKHSNTDFTSWAKGQMDYITGNNPSGTNFVVGFASNSAKNPHHRAASGYNNYDEMKDRTTISSNGHLLVGALVGGPEEANGTYHDDINDYVCNEVAVDYNAGFVGAAAGLYENYKSGSTVSSIEGVTKIYSGSSIEPTTTTATTNNGNQPTTTTTTAKSGKSGEYEIKPNQNINYSQLPENDKMIGWDWSDFDIAYGEKALKVEVNISTNSGSVGKWQGAFGSSTKIAPDYWIQSTDMEKSISGKSGTITWEIPSSVASDLSYGDGQLKFGIWWIDCGQFTIDSVKVYTDGTTAVQTTTAMPATTAATTTAPVITTATTTQQNLNVTLWGDANCDGEVDMGDAVAILKYLADPVGCALTEQGKLNGDVHKNGNKLDSSDALSIQKLRAKQISALPES